MRDRVMRNEEITRRLKGVMADIKRRCKKQRELIDKLKPAAVEADTGIVRGEEPPSEEVRVALARKELDGAYDVASSLDAVRRELLKAFPELLGSAVKRNKLRKDKGRK